MLIFAANCNVGGSGLSADVRYCIFGEDERAIEVPREGESPFFRLHSSITGY